jgi:hypothetical protein
MCDATDHDGVDVEPEAAGARARGLRRRNARPWRSGRDSQAASEVPEAHAKFKEVLESIAAAAPSS